MIERLLKRLAETLEEAQIPYMIIGGQAVLFYGFPRLTQDVDVTLGVDIDAYAKVKGEVEASGGAAGKLCSKNARSPGERFSFRFPRRFHFFKHPLRAPSHPQVPPGAAGAGETSHRFPRRPPHPQVSGWEGDRS